MEDAFLKALSQRIAFFLRESFELLVGCFIEREEFIGQRDVQFKVMKTVHNIYDELIKIENVFHAWHEFQLGKSGKIEVMKFGFNLEDNLFQLRDELAKSEYRHGAYQKFVIHDPKQRIIHKAKIKDRIVHTLAAKELERLYQPTFITDSFACQKDKGIHRGLSRVVAAARKVSKNYTSNFWYLKCDVRKFFDNIDHSALISILRRKIKDERFLRLLVEIIGSFYKDEQGKGLPLGNFTSQWLANIYLNELDCFAKHDLKIRYYFRYADDVLIFNDDAGKLREHLSALSVFLAEKLCLRLHDDKTFIKKFSQGIDFVGYRILPRYVIIKPALKKRILRRMAARRMALARGEIGLSAYTASLNSYYGCLKHCSGYGVQNKIIHQSINQSQYV